MRESRQQGEASMQQRQRAHAPEGTLFLTIGSGLSQMPNPRPASAYKTVHAFVRHSQQQCTSENRNIWRLHLHPPRDTSQQEMDVVWQAKQASWKMEHQARKSPTRSRLDQSAMFGPSEMPFTRGNLHEIKASPVGTTRSHTSSGK